MTTLKATGRDLELKSDQDIALYPNDHVWISEGTKLIFEGTVPDNFEAKLQATAVTADRDLILPDSSGTLATQEWANAQGFGGGGTLTIQDEGSALASTATILNFVGAGVTATGTGSTKTITISGSSGITDIVNDTTPQLGGDLDTNGNSIFIGTNRVQTVSGTPAFLDFNVTQFGQNNNTVLAGTQSINMFLDSNGGDTGQAFRIYNNTDPDSNPTESTHIFKVDESGNVSCSGSITSSAAGTPTLTSSGDLNIQAGTGAADRVEILQAPFKIASFTTVERDAKTSENGDMIYNTTANRFQGYANGAWVDLH